MNLFEIAERLNYLADVLIPNMHENISKANQLIKNYDTDRSIPNLQGTRRNLVVGVDSAHRDY